MDLQRRLAVVAQFRIQDGQLLSTELTGNLNRRIGVRQLEDEIQLGLTEYEIRGIHSRVRWLLRQVDSGKIEVF